ncbi:hypothetical protein K438DRAFT_644418 [Mycena galopus ATCC 62051]|nr:hypothetical protein K438DRAFT_644418 [Mycena galopus ATCC 62051]
MAFPKPQTPVASSSPIVLNFLFKYSPEKTAVYAQLDRAELNSRLRLQLGALKMLLPKSDNVRFVAGVGVHFFWVTTKDSVHHQSMTRAFKMCSTAVMRSHFIESMEMSLTAKPALLEPAPTALFLPPALRRDSSDFNSNVAHTPEANAIRDEAQYFLDGLRLCAPRPESRAPSRRASSIASSIPSFHTEIFEPGATSTAGSLDAFNETSVVALVTGVSESRASSPDSVSMVMSDPSPPPSPIPGSWAFP